MRARLVGHLELVTIEPISRASTHVDADADEPYGGIARAVQIQLLAQVREDRRNERRPGQGGASLPVAMRLAFLTRSVRGAGWTPADGDHVVQLADRRGGNPVAVSLYVQGPRFSGKTRYDNELVMLDLVARKSRQPNEGLT